MTQRFTCSDKETLIAFIYGECDAADREGVERHLAECAACADEVQGFGVVRTALAEWTPPERVAGFRLVRDEEPVRAAEPVPATVLRPARWWQRSMPTWAKAAAAVLLFAAGAGLSNLDITYRDGALTIRTGWARPVVTAHNAPASTPAVTPAAAQGDAAPWRADLAVLERNLRDDFTRQLTARADTQQASAVGYDERRVMAKVQEMIGNSERRTQTDLAMRVAQVQGEFGFQRASDLARVRQGLGQVEGRVGAEALTQRQMLNYLLTVSQKK